MARQSPALEPAKSEAASDKEIASLPGDLDMPAEGVTQAEVTGPGAFFCLAA